MRTWRVAAGLAVAVGPQQTSLPQTAITLIGCARSGPLFHRARVLVSGWDPGSPTRLGNFANCLIRTSFSSLTMDHQVPVWTTLVDDASRPPIRLSGPTLSSALPAAHRLARERWPCPMTGTKFVGHQHNGDHGVSAIRTRRNKSANPWPGLAICVFSRVHSILASNRILGSPCLS